MSFFSEGRKYFLGIIFFEGAFFFFFGGALFGTNTQQFQKLVRGLQKLNIYVLSTSCFSKGDLRDLSKIRWDGGGEKGRLGDMRNDLGALHALDDLCDLDDLHVQGKLDVLKSPFCVLRALLAIISKRPILPRHLNDNTASPAPIEGHLVLRCA